VTLKRDLAMLIGAREKKGFHDFEELRLILDLPMGQLIRQPRNGGNGETSGKETTLR
jgi:hypothetical protein